MNLFCLIFFELRIVLLTGGHGKRQSQKVDRSRYTRFHVFSNNGIAGWPFPGHPVCVVRGQFAKFALQSSKIVLYFTTTPDQYDIEEFSDAAHSP
jgi:hypothetical protein